VSTDVLHAARYLACSKAIATIGGLETLLGAPVLQVRHGQRPPLDGSVVLAWGRKPSARQTEVYAARHGLPMIYLEDGFARSVEPGRVAPPFSLVCDDLGIYYDAETPSRLERLIAAPLTSGRAKRARRLRHIWRQGRVSKYNHAREPTFHVPEGAILVVDQTFGDAAIHYGGADPGSFARMLEAALDEHPGAPVLLKVHPEVVCRRKRGHFDLARLAGHDRVRVIGTDAHPPGLLERVAAVYVVTSQMGFEALLWDRPVRVFGMPFYAGWGLTDDDLPGPRRRGPADLDSLVAAALDEYPRYRDPESGVACPAERVLSWFALQRRQRQRFPAQVYGLGFSAWKRPIVRTFFQGSQVTFVKRAKAVPTGATVAVWGRSQDSETARQASRIRLEDGFLRSVGLGVDLVQPLSWVMDASGMYYDATAPSDLERLLAETDFPADLLVRAQTLRQAIVRQGITKYNTGSGQWTRPEAAKRVVLVPGQVEADASIRYGASGLRTNMALLAAVRQAEPEAYLVYKPHPDVVAGICHRGEGEANARDVCDAVVVDTPIDVLLSQVDAVHVLTSLAGFEALLRDRPVFCHGWPFYAGWGLTTDNRPVPRRTRRLTLDALVAGALLLYPTYIHPATGRFTSAEGVLQALVHWRATAKPIPWWRRHLRFLLALLKRA